MDILNHYDVTANIASSGQPSAAQLEEIAASGYQVVINLAMPDHENSIANEGSIVTSLGMTYIHIPVPFDAPTDDHLATFSGYMDALERKKSGYTASLTRAYPLFCFATCKQTGVYRRSSRLHRY